MAGGLQLAIEDDFRDLRDHQTTSVLAELLFFLPGGHVCRTAISKQTFRTNANLNRDRSTFTLLDAEFLKQGNTCWLMQQDTSTCIVHEVLSPECFQHAIEACSGIAAVTTGYEEIGVNTKVFIDQNKSFCNWLQAKYGETKTFLCGDAGDNSVIAATARSMGKPAILSAGIACQPYSFLGDRKEGDDKRSESLPAVLKLGYFLRSPLIILECTRGARDSAYVQRILADFVSKTGYELFQDVIHLHHTWTSQRTRWWAVLKIPNLNLKNFPQMPELVQDPQIAHLMQIQRFLPEHDMQQLMLDQRETMLFHQQKKGISGSLLNENSNMPTATHSWGSQLVACKCGCRSSGFSQDRLNEKGLYGVLVSLETTVIHDDQVFHATRHPDPREMAILMGLAPSYLQTEETYHLRFLMAAVGQSASPLQGAWVLGNVLSGMKSTFDVFPFADPLTTIGNMGLKLMNERFQCWTNQVHTFKTKVLQDQFQRFTAASSDSVYIASDRVQIEFSTTECTAPAPCIDTPTDSHAEISIASQVTQTTAAELLAGSVDDVFNRPTAPGSEASVPVHSVQSMQQHIQSSSKSNPPRPSIAPHILKHPASTALHDVSIPEIYTEHGALLAFANKRKIDSVTHDHDAGVAEGDNQPPKCTKLNLPTEEDATIDIPPAQCFSPEAPSATEHDASPNCFHDTAAHPAEEISPTQEWTQPAVADFIPSVSHSQTISTTTHTDAHSNLSNHALPGEQELKPFPEFTRSHVFIGMEHQSIRHTEVDVSSTWGQIASAEQKLHGFPVYLKPLSAVGSDLPNYAESQAGEIVLLRPIEFEPCQCPKTGRDSIPDLTGLTRIEALWNQFGWVAVDEMTYYLNWFNKPDHETTAPMVLRDLPDDPIKFGSWLLTAIEKASVTDTVYQVGTCILHDEHWFPLHVRISAKTNEMTICITPDSTAKIRSLLHRAFGDMEFSLQVQPVLSQFPADCGFQSLAFVIGFGNGDNTLKPIQSGEATQWRRMFASFLTNTDKHLDVVISIRLGGMPDMNTHKDLSNLLESHGVTITRSSALATQLISAIGLPGIQSVLSSSRAWRDLKSKASACKPPIQLIMDDELQAQIDRRRAEGKPFGRKQSKAKTTQKSQLPQQIHLKANQIQIPNGIFKQEDGAPVSQISLQQLRQKTPGIAVLNKEDAEPFLQLREPLSPEGVGMIIVDYKDLQLPPNHTLLTFPASFAETSDPMIVSAALVQLGSKTIGRLMPTNPISIEQIDTQVVRCVLFRDQFEGDWTQVMQRPFKTIQNLDCMREVVQADILDCWDRQFLNKQYQKSKPETAEIYSITCRFRLPAAQIVLAANAQSGLFTEPRAQHGREPCDQFKVVWLPKKTFSEALVAQQVTECHTSIARSGDRYGLRVANDMVKKVHEQNRPGITYLDNTSVRQYQISPLPFGTTKQSLQKVCDTWGWSARPNHTIGLTSDKGGLIWVVSASQPPQFWIWTMTHGDVLITELVQKHALPPIKSQPVIASQRTLKHLLDAHNSTSQVEPTDPWLKKDQDPWMPASHAVTGAAITNGQIAKIEANFERKLRNALHDQQQANAKMSDESMDPSADSRIQKLEQQVTQLQDSFSGLTTSVNTFQQQQTAVNQQMSQQVQQIKTHLDNQTQSVQGMLDSKLEEQMARIERLLSGPEKRAKTNSHE